MKNITKIISTVSILMVVVVLSAGCASSNTQTIADKVATVQRGNLSVDITAAGNLALSKTEDLAFDIPSTFSKTSPITVEEVMVETGDSVQAGQELVKLDTTDWNNQLKTLQKALTTAQRDLATAQRAVTEKEFAINQAQIALQSAQDDMDQIDAVKQIQDEIDNDELMLKFWKMVAMGQLAATGDTVGQIAYWTTKRAEDKADLQELINQGVAQITSGSTAQMSREVALEVAQGEMTVEQKQMALDDAQIAVDNAKLDEADAEQDVADAQSNLDEANGLSPIITAPFDGFITAVNVQGGDEILKGTVAMTIADPNKFEAQIMVSENDILNVTLNGTATVQAQALPGVTFPAKVTQISPTATIQSGVVNYQVMVEITSLQPITTRTQTGTGATGNVTSGAPSASSGSSGRGFSSGNLTQEQLDQFMQWRQQATSGQGSATTTTPAAEVKLTDGLTVTVTITTAQRNNVLLVPNSAITTRGNETVVQVVKDGATEERIVQTGISNWQYTEITSGLSEGEQVTIPQTMTTTTTTTSQQAPRGIFFGGR